MEFLIYGIVPVPAWLAVSGLFLFDSYNTITSARPGVDTAGRRFHVGLRT